MEERRELHINQLHSALLQSIFRELGPKHLCQASAVCTLWRDLNLDSVADKIWRKYYLARWPVLGQGAGKTGWQRLYAAKVRKSRIWLGQYQADSLFGHKGGVRCIKLLPEQNLLVTGSLDKTVRVWDLEGGLPLSCSKLHGGTVRRLAVGSNILVSGSSDSTVRVWNLPKFKTCNTLPSKKLTGHTGPISGLAVTDSTIVSGSWDRTVRMWSEKDTKCMEVLKYDDWVWALACCGQSIAVAAGKDLILQDIDTGKVVHRAVGIRKEGHVSCLDCSQDGRAIFTGAADGVVQMHDTRSRFNSCTLWTHRGGVSDLAFEDPWIASSSHDGTLVVTNVEKQLHTSDDVGHGRTDLFAKGSNHRQFALMDGPVYCIDMCNEWLACGSESPVVKSWDFRGAEEAALKAKAQRAARRRKRKKKLEPRDLLPCIMSSDDDDVKPESKYETESFHEDDPDSPKASLIPPSELVQHACGYWNHFHGQGRGGESTDEGEMLEAFA